MCSSRRRVDHVCVVRRDELACPRLATAEGCCLIPGGRGASARGVGLVVRAGRSRSKKSASPMRAKRRKPKGEGGAAVQTAPPPQAPLGRPHGRGRAQTDARGNPGAGRAHGDHQAPREPRRRGRRRQPPLRREGGGRGVRELGGCARRLPQRQRGGGDRAHHADARGPGRRSPSSSWATRTTSWVSARATPRTTTSGTKTRRRTPNASPRPRRVSAR